MYPRFNPLIQGNHSHLNPALLEAKFSNSERYLISKQWN